MSRRYSVREIPLFGQYEEYRVLAITTAMLLMTNEWHLHLSQIESNPAERRLDLCINCGYDRRKETIRRYCSEIKVIPQNTLGSEYRTLDKLRFQR